MYTPQKLDCSLALGQVVGLSRFAQESPKRILRVLNPILEPKRDSRVANLHARTTQQFIQSGAIAGHPGLGDRGIFALVEAERTECIFVEADKDIPRRLPSDAAEPFNWEVCSGRLSHLACYETAAARPHSRILGRERLPEFAPPVMPKIPIN